MDTPPHHHQSLLQGIIDLTCAQPKPIEPSLRAKAEDKFHRIISHFEPAATDPGAHYNRPALVRLTYEYSRSEQAKDMFLRVFFGYMALKMDNSRDDANLANPIV